MSIILQDPAHLDTPDRSPVRPTSPLDPASVPGKRDFTFELESPGSYLRAVTGTIAYLDDEAQTFMVRAHDGKLIRVPRRDIRATTIL